MHAGVHFNINARQMLTDFKERRQLPEIKLYQTEYFQNLSQFTVVVVISKQTSSEIAR